MAWGVGKIRECKVTQSYATILEVYLRPLHLTILDKTILDLDYLRQLSWNFIDLDLDIKIELLPPPPSVKSL